MSTSNERDVDVIVVGGGPVGLACALYAADSGLAPVVIEPRSGVIDKACGEGLMPGAVLALADLGVDPPGRDLLGIRYLAAGRSAQADFRRGPGRGVRRTALHAALRDAVAGAGIETLTLSAAGIVQDGQGVTVSTTGPGGEAGPDLRACYVLAADGLRSPTRRALGLDPGHPPRSSALDRGPERSSRQRVAARRFGLRQHHRVSPWSDHVEVYWGPHGEAYVTPVADDLVGVAVLSPKRIPLGEHLVHFPELREHLGASEVATSVLGAGPLRQRATRRVSGRVLLVGDASGYVDALTGEGIAVGLAQARAAVAAVRAGRPDDYERGWQRATRRYSVMTHALVHATRPGWARRALVPAATILTPVFHAAVNELARPSPRSSR